MAKRPIDWSAPTILMTGPDGNLYTLLGMAKYIGRAAAKRGIPLRDRDRLARHARRISAAAKGDPKAQAEIDRVSGGMKLTPVQGKVIG